MNYRDHEMLPLRAFQPEGGRMRLYSSDSPPPPDYTPMANASAESARIMGDLGQQQLDFSKQQYEDAKPLANKIVDQQMAIADKTAAQGDDYYNYLKSYRPAERALLHESMGLTPDQVAELETITQSGDQAAYDAKLSAYGVDASKRAAAEIASNKAKDEADAAIIGGTDSDVLAARRGEIDAGVGRAVADAQGGFTRNINQVIRQGLRYGGTPGAIAATAGATGMAQASATASAANTARTQGIMGARGQAETSMNLRRNIADNVTKQESVGWAKKLDASGLVKGLPGASTGAYGLAVNAGNSAGANQAAPGAQMQAGMAAGANTVASGRSLYQQGLGSILNSQTSMYANAPEDQTGAALGAVAGIAGAVMMSDRRLKRNIVKIGTRADRLNVYAYEYVWGGGMQIGVMADEVRAIYPGAVIAMPGGYSAVDYARI